MTRKIALLIVVLGIVGVLAGGAFIGIAVQKNNMVTAMLTEQKITTGLTKDQIAAGQIVDTPGEVQAAADTIAAHLKSIAPSYTALMAQSKTGKYDPTDVKQLDYSQGMVLADTLNMVVLGYGVIQETVATGAVLIALGLGIAASGLAIFRIAKS